MTYSSSEQAAFAAALACPTAAERAACLDACCGEDTVLRRRVEALLSAATQAGNFLETPPHTLSGEIAAVLTAEDLFEKPGDRIGRYKLLEKIGEGGCGIVYMAEQEEPVRRRVALKVIKPGMDSRAVIARFEAERQALAMMDHANIARVLDGGATPAGRPYFVMELVRGVPVTAFCDEARLSTAGRLRLFIQICQAVQHAHQKGIIHRDLKPSNILVTVNDGVPVPKVIDFGIAKATGQRLTDKSLFTQFHSFIGTPAYTSPEQAEMSSVDIDTRSDIYSLGVLLYELLTSRTPFDGEELLRSGLDEMRRIIRTEEPPRPSNRLGKLEATVVTALSAQRRMSVPELTGAVRGDLDWIVMKCLEKDRTRRYETASGLAADVQCHLDNEPIAARPPGQFYRFGKLVRRNRGAFAALTAIALVLCAGIVVSASLAMRASRGEASARDALAELRASAPAFAAQARGLAAAGQFDSALEKLDQAIRISPQNTAYLFTRAGLLESLLRFPEAAAAYRILCERDPGHTRAQTRLTLCGQLGPQPGSPSQAWFDTLTRLYVVSVTDEDRSGAEMYPIARLVLENVRTTLRNSSIPNAGLFEQSLSLGADGVIALEITKSSVSDFNALRGLPLRVVNAKGCPVTDLGPLRESPLQSLNISFSNVLDLSPLRDIATLRNFSMAGTRVADLTPLRDLPLEWVEITNTPVSDLTPLRHRRLQVLRMGGTRVKSLEPLAGMPVKELDCRGIPATDFSPLSRCPDISYLLVAGTALNTLEIFRNHQLRNIDFDRTAVQDISPLAGMPLYSVEFYLAPVTDVSPLLKCPTLANIGLPGTVSNVECLRSLPQLRRISYRRGKNSEPSLTAADFWKNWDAAVP